MKQFTDPELEITRFDIEDMITTSGDIALPTIDNGIGWG